jgi:hypothetical protein
MFKNIFIKMIILVTMVFFTACTATTQEIKKDTKPEWITNYNVDDKYYHGVGKSGVHINGEDGQRKLALERAITDVAYQMKTEIEIDSVNQSNLNGQQKSIRFEDISHQHIKKTSIQVKIKEVWKDNLNGDLYVWVVKKK